MKKKEHTKKLVIYLGYKCTTCRLCVCKMVLEDKTMFTAPPPSVCPWGTGYLCNWRKYN